MRRKEEQQHRHRKNVHAEQKLFDTRSMDLEGNKSEPADVPEERVKTTYWGLIMENSNYRWFLVSYIATHCGE